MAKIVIRIPEPKEEYEVSNQKQINRAIALITEQFNSTFLDELKQETERFTWFKSAADSN
jgi:DNA-binding HxlR family transcriptional regulator